MKKTGRNDPCPCGSGKKFKKCHMGREEELYLNSLEEISTEEMGEKIIALPTVNFGRSEEIISSLDIHELTGKKYGVKFVDLKAYAGLSFIIGHQSKLEKGAGGVFINLYKTRAADPDNIYLAISKDIDDSTLIHELAHVLDYLGGSELMPGTLGPLSLELEVPLEHLEHPDEYGHWLDYLKERFQVRLDADDTIISYLYNKDLLIKGQDISQKNGFMLKSKSTRILTYMSENSEEIDAIIRNLNGYIGSKENTEQ